MSSPFLGEIRIWALTYAPHSWAYCNGQTMAISQNTALFALLGTYYGGNGTTTFALPNFQGRVPIHYGTGSGLSLYSIGESGGAANVALTLSEMPAHTHTLQGDREIAAQTAVNGNMWAGTTGSAYAAATNSSAMAPATVALAGSNIPHNNLQPYLALNFCIALQGLFPSRN